MTPEPATVEEASDPLAQVRQRIADSYDDLPPRLQQISRFVLEHPNYIAIDTVADNAKRVGVPPSAMIRFAQTLGFSGFRELQRLFQSPLLDRSPSYAERVRQLASGAEPKGKGLHGLLRDFASATTVALDHLPDSIASEGLERAVNVMAAADRLHLIGQRRSFPVVSYLAYACAHAGKPAHILSSLAGMLVEEGQSIRPGDCLIAVSFATYSPDTLMIAEAAHERAVQVIAITDSVVSPLSRHADIVFEVKEAEVQGFRSLASSLCLAQALAVGLAMRLAS
jgi:DNA-binding MurR/RpiR family transcriptional regulator